MERREPPDPSWSIEGLSSPGHDKALGMDMKDCRDQGKWEKSEKFQLGQRLAALQSPGDGDPGAVSDPELRSHLHQLPLESMAMSNPAGSCRRALGIAAGNEGRSSHGRALLLSGAEAQDQSDLMLCTRFKQCLEAKSFPKLAGLGRDVLFVSLGVWERFLKSM